MKGLDQHYDDILDRYQDLVNEEDTRSSLAAAERTKLLDLVIEVQGALTMGDKDTALCILNQLEKELE